MEQGDPSDSSGQGHKTQADGENVGAVSRRTLRKPGLLIAVLAVAATFTIIGMVLLPPPFESFAIFIVGVPVMVWLIHRDRQHGPQSSRPPRSRP
ncbi:hypothetical protein ABZ721_31455 [Streptomyces sp. NPDC006733]|uniref:hypothetical protein n=1 Tax=Streptomyces sp. NPDC006733 TaxID=3155460 RepID=UPI0033E1C263